MIMNWENGRGKPGPYQKLLLLSSGLFPFDIYLLKFPKGSSLDPHIDEVANRRHYRLNLMFGRWTGGDMWLTKNPLVNGGRHLVLFRPDITRHWVEQVTSGTLWMLSIGWLR